MLFIMSLTNCAVKPRSDSEGSGWFANVLAITQDVDWLRVCLYQVCLGPKVR